MSGIIYLQIIIIEKNLKLVWLFIIFSKACKSINISEFYVKVLLK